MHALCRGCELQHTEADIMYYTAMQWHMYRYMQETSGSSLPTYLCLQYPGDHTSARRWGDV